MSGHGDWFVVNLGEAQAFRHEEFGSAVMFEGDGNRFEQFAINVRWLEPGQPASMYHSEAAQEAYLVIHGEATLIVDDSERPLRAWDFVHLPPGTPHALAGAGDSPCAVIMVGTRLEDPGLSFPVSEAAARYGASVEAATDDRAEAYAGKSSGFEARDPFWPPAGPTPESSRDEDEVRTPPADGWFVVNLAEAHGERWPKLGAWMPLEPSRDTFPDFGINVHVLEPGEPNGMYHGEAAQEGFMVIHGEALLIVEDTERPLRTWDYFHCPPDVDHIVVGAGDGPCAILMIGRRGEEFDDVEYPYSEVAARYGGSVPEPGISREHAYDHVDAELVPEHIGWPPGTGRGRL